MGKPPWVSRSVGSHTFAALAHTLSGSELQSLMLHAMAERARDRAPKHVLQQFERDAFCLPAAVDQRLQLAIDTELLAAAMGFEALELSPVAPLGTCSRMALTSQHRVLTALRNTEVVSDPTNVLALECARRMRREPGRAIHLTTSQRVIRAQPVPKLPGYAQHFRIFVLASAGNESKDHGFSLDTLSLHINTMLAALERLERHGYAFGARHVTLLATPKRAPLADRIAERLTANVKRDALDHPYYSAGLRYQLWVTAQDGIQLPLVDGGAFEWLQTLTSNQRAVYVASGLGAQLIPLQFRAANTTSEERP
jgi:hypothetical protein